MRFDQAIRKANKYYNRGIIPTKRELGDTLLQIQCAADHYARGRITQEQWDDFCKRCFDLKHWEWARQNPKPEFSKEQLERIDKNLKK